MAFVVSDLTYPPREGLHQQTILLLSALHKRSVAFDLLGYCKNNDQLDRIAMRADLGFDFSESPLICGRGRLAVGILNRLNRTMGSQSRELLARVQSDRYDLIHLDGAAACGLLRAGTQRRTIVSLIDPPSRRHLRMAQVGNQCIGRLAHVALGMAALLFEVSLRSRQSWWHVVSESDAAYVRKVLRQHQTIAIPVMLPEETLTGTSRTSNGPSTTTGLIFADLRQPSMQEAVAQFAAHVIRPFVETDRSCRFIVLGRKPPDLRTSEACAGLPITFLGWVDNYLDVLQASDLIILPDVAGTGLKNRAAQAMALSRAVLATGVALEGIEARHLRSAWIYNDYREALEGLSTLVRNPALRVALGREAHKVAARTYANDCVVQAWLRLYQSIGKGHPPS